MVTFSRGNSKYHYYGIRVKPGSSLIGLDESANRSVPSSTMSNKVSGNASRGFKRNNDSVDSSVSVNVISQHLAYLGDGSNAIPNFPDIHFNTSLPDECGYDDIDTLK